MSVIKIKVKDRIATNLTPDTKIVCDNEGYEVEFEFDEIWSESGVKTALFITPSGTIPIPFDGTKCSIPIIENAEVLGIGVKSSDVEGLHTSTAAYVKCLYSAEDEGEGEIAPPQQDVYDRIIEILNEYIEMDVASRSEVIEIVNEKTEPLQPSYDKNLQTESKSVVGAINEAYAKASEEKVNEETVKVIIERETEPLRTKVDELGENKVEKTDRANQLYGTDENGNPAFYPTDSVGTKVFVEGEEVKEFNADTKFDQKGGIISGDVSIQGNLSVVGTTTTKDTETLKVKDNVVVANSDGVDLIEESGFAIRTNKTDAYGIMYDPVGDGVKIGLGGFTEDGKFVYNAGEAQFLATRSDNIESGNIPVWDNEAKQFVDSGYDKNELVKSGITENDVELSAAEKAKACSWLGAAKKEDIAGFQEKRDESLKTTDKTIIGAINEINAKVGLGGGGSGAPSNNAVLTLTNTSGWLSKSIAENADCEISVEWSSIEGGLSTGNGIIRVYVNDAIKTSYEVSQGGVTVNVGKYLTVGTNKVQVEIMDIYGNVKVVTYSINSVIVSISSYFDGTTAYTGDITYSYTPVGAIEKNCSFLD